MPLAFTQNDLLSPDEFLKRAEERGLRITEGQLQELHRRRVLVPMYRLRARPRPGGVATIVHESFSNTKYRLGGNLGMVLAAAEEARLEDPAAVRFRPWAGGHKRRWNGIETRSPSVFYSPYQLIALRIVRSAAQHMIGHRDPDGRVSFELPELFPTEIGALSGGRQLAVLLSAIDMRYLPHIVLTAHHADLWQEEDPKFDIQQRTAQLGISPEELARAADSLLGQARFVDPLGDWWDLLRQGHPDTWKQLKGDALLALDYRIAAEILLAAVDDLEIAKSFQRHRRAQDGWSELCSTTAFR